MVYVLFFIGLLCLAYGGDCLVNGSVAMAKKLKVSTLLIGIVLVGFGTSMPELVTSLLAVLRNPPSPGIAVGNVVGSNIANILLILGVAAVISPIEVNKKSFARDITFLILGTVLLCVGLYFDVLEIIMGSVMLVALIGYTVYCYFTEKETSDENDEQNMPLWKMILYSVGGIALMIAGAKLLVDSSVTIARSWGISETIIGLTMVAIGTSLPELATSISAAVKKQNNIAFGNVVGSNIYNTLFILGVTALFTKVAVPADVYESIYAMIGATVVLLLSGIYGKITRPMGALFLLLYAGYIYWLQ